MPRLDGAKPRPHTRNAISPVPPKYVLLYVLVILCYWGE